MRRSKRAERIAVWSTAGLVFLLFGLPLALRFAGDRAAKSIQAYPDKPASVASFSTAILLYDLARISPLFWRTLDDRRDNARYMLSSGFGYRIFYGYDGPQVADQHIQFLRSIRDDASWRVSLVNNLAKYGRYEEALDAARQSGGDSNAAEAASAAALAIGDVDALTEHASNIDWRATPYAFKARVLVIAGLHDALGSWIEANPDDTEASLFDAEILRRTGNVGKAREKVRAMLESETLLEDEATQLFARTLDNSATDDDFEFLHDRLAESPYDAEQMCSWLALASAELERDNRDGALEAVSGALDAADYCVKGYFMLYRLQSHWFRGCNPELFDGAQEILERELDALGDDDTGGLADDPRTLISTQLATLYVYESMTWLSLLSASEAEEALDRAEGLSKDMMQIPYYRVIAMQVRGDLDGAREIIDNELGDHPGLALHLLARVALQNGEIGVARDSFEKLARVERGAAQPWSPFANHSMQEEASIIKTVIGMPLDSQEYWTGHDMPPDRIDGDVEARDWLSTFSGHPRHPRMEHQFMVPLLARWGAASEEAGFWLGYHRYEGVSPLGALVRAHWQYLYAVSRGDEAGAERFQARMVAVREIFLENDIWPLIDCEMVLY